MPVQVAGLGERLGAAEAGVRSVTGVCALVLVVAGDVAEVGTAHLAVVGTLSRVAAHVRHQGRVLHEALAALDAPVAAVKFAAVSQLVQPVLAGRVEPLQAVLDRCSVQLPPSPPPPLLLLLRERKIQSINIDLRTYSRYTRIVRIRAPSLALYNHLTIRRLRALLQVTAWSGKTELPDYRKTRERRHGKTRKRRHNLRGAGQEQAVVARFPAVFVKKASEAVVVKNEREDRPPLAFPHRWKDGGSLIGVARGALIGKPTRSRLSHFVASAPLINRRAGNDRRFAHGDRMWQRQFPRETGRSGARPRRTRCAEQV
ncbi:hypothetical protein MRX96_023638 [Rhipicephalus microplus]